MGELCAVPILPRIRIEKESMYCARHAVQLVQDQTNVESVCCVTLRYYHTFMPYAVQSTGPSFIARRQALDSVLYCVVCTSITITTRPAMPFIHVTNHARHTCKPRDHLTWQIDIVPAPIGRCTASA